MLNTFYEWQSGNQFYGSARYEPGTSNDFDSDAQYVLGKDYVAELLIINKELLGYRATAAKTQGVLAGSEQQNLVATLKKLAVLGTPDRPIPANDAGAWTALNSNEKQELLVVIEGYDRVAASGAAGPRDNNKNIHKDIVREGLKKSRKSLWDRDKTSVHDVYDRLNAGSGTVIHPLVASWTIVITKLTLTIAGRKASVTVDKSSISMDTVRDALDELFVATTTEVFGL